MTFFELLVIRALYIIILVVTRQGGMRPPGTDLWETDARKLIKG